MYRQHYYDRSTIVPTNRRFDDDAEAAAPQSLLPTDLTMT
jgi:hypothetical protein